MGQPKWKDSKGKPSDKELHETGIKKSLKSSREMGRRGKREKRR